ncbi:hypothetical protein NEOLEDRAFT_1129754 [Neolentinus lepideus HHB14362 ss-1]|uniref:Protein kinase domain-containing protein n=1 Tax=Neolentinus lepideus HHB14362 ss-1 TaxID=1314782 RepID=A0A165ULM1_9AGAM|nr:hypothetical protein NEOLEDRAFT_1129754 [Neolentinus lepideus HHB14362 ss-1]
MLAATIPSSNCLSNLRILLRPSRPLSSVTGAMCSAFRSIRPHDAFLTIPPPPPAERPGSFNSSSGRPITAGSSIFLRDSSPTQFDALWPVVHQLSSTLRNCHRRRIHWPVHENSDASNIQQYYLDVLLRPVTFVFNQLRNQAVFPEITCYKCSTNGGTTITSFSYHLEQPRDYAPPFDFPIIIFLPRHLLDIEPFALLSEVDDAILQAVNMNSRATILCTDLSTCLILRSHRGQGDGSMLLCEHVKLPDLRALRIIIAAYVLQSISRSENPYIEVPAMCGHIEHTTFEGPSLDTSKVSILPDEEICRTRHRHVDFDFVALTKDYRQTQQFFHWKAWIRDNVSPRIAGPGDIVIGETEGFARRHGQLVPLYNVEELSEEIKHHIRSVKRPYPRVFLSSSRSFSLQLLEELTPKRTSGCMCRTYTCKVVAVDDSSVDESSPVLCVKLFDDRFHKMDTDVDVDSHDDQNTPPPEELPWWLIQYQNAEDGIRCEDMAYKQLRFLQGALVPWYLGSHKFILPTGHEVYGILMEYIPAMPLGQGYAIELNTKQQVELVQSVGIAVRALEHADISQHDWHKGQILVNRHRSCVHCVLIDFACASTSLHHADFHRDDDFGFAFDTLSLPETGIDRELIWNHLGERQCWDTISSTTVINGESRRLRSPENPYKFVWTHNINI